MSSIQTRITTIRGFRTARQDWGHSTSIGRLPRSLAGAVVLAIGLVCSAHTLAAVDNAPSVALSELQPTSEHKRAARVMVDLMRRYHYRKVDLDDHLSRQIFERYLDVLDPNRAFLLASDIAEFDAARDTFDDELKLGRPNNGFEMFKRYRQRVELTATRVRKMIDATFDFALNEQLELDRSEASWAPEQGELDQYWRKRIKNSLLELKLAGRSDEQARETLHKRYGRMLRRVSLLNADDVFQLILNAYAVSVEPHTAYFSPRTSENFKIRMSLSLEGIGAALQVENEYTVVRRIITGGPADLGNQLKIDDRIVGVAQGEDGEIIDVVSWRLEDVVDLIRGPKGTVVQLQILPAEAPIGGPPSVIALTRDKINLGERAAKSSTVEALLKGRKVKIGVIDVPTFYLDSEARARGDSDYRSTTRDVRKLISKLEDEGVAGIVIDLRGNSGGSLVEATELSGLFIRSGPIVQIKDAFGRLQVTTDPDPALVYDGPLAVLVDRRSASASEIFAGAIQDYNRGVIVGEPSFGKGTVQNLYDLNRRGGRGQLKITIAQFFRVNGDGTQHRGVVPDVALPTAEHADDEGERALDNALPWAAVRPATFEGFNQDHGAVKAAYEKHRQRVSSSEAFQVVVAELAEISKLRKEQTVSLNEVVRRESHDMRNDTRTARIDRLKELLGINDEGKNEAVNPVAELLLRETAQILADIIAASSSASPGSMADGS